MWGRVENRGSEAVSGMRSGWERAPEAASGSKRSTAENSEWEERRDEGPAPASVRVAKGAPRARAARRVIRSRWGSVAGSKGRVCDGDPASGIGKRLAPGNGK